jgi:hypothetical protein
VLSEVAVGPKAGQARKIPDLFARMRHYVQTRLVRHRQHQGTSHQDWHIEGNPAAEAAFRRGASTLTLVHP